MRSFREISEASGDTAVFTFGRFNPPTTGHEKLIDALARESKKVSGSKMYVFASHSQDPKKNPLPYPKKIAYMKKMFPKYKSNITTAKQRNVFEIATFLHDKGHRAVVMVVGSDRVDEFDRLLNQYNGVKGRHGYYGFDSIEVVSAGERDPDAEGVEGMSASKMRAAAAEGEFDQFKQGLPSGFKDAKKLFRDVLAGMGIREERDMGEMTDYEELRDAYLTNKIWRIDDLVEANGVEGRIVRRGTNYISYMDGSGKVHKAWLQDIALNERNYRKEYDNYHSRPEQIEKRSSRNKARRAMGDNAVKGMDVGHKDNNPLNNDPKNLRNEDPSTNRREPRLREAKAPDVKKGDVIIVSKSKRPYKMGGVVDPKTTLPAESDKMVVKKVTKSKDGRKAHLTHHDPKKRGGYAIYLDKMPDFMSVKIAEEVELDEMAWFMRAKAKIDQMTHPKGFEKMVKQFADRMTKPENKNRNPSAVAADVAREYDVSARTFIQYTNKLVQKGVLPKQLKAEVQNEMITFKDLVTQINEVKQDKDIKKRPGTQPAKYYAKDSEGDAMAKSTKQARARHFAKKKAGPAPGDASATTKPSKHTKKFKQMYGEQPEHEIKVGDYTTKFFHMCGSAQKVMKKNADVEGAEELTKLQDVFYKLEKDVVDAGSATDEQKTRARDLYNQIMKKAGEIGLADDIDDYMKMHIDSIEKGDPKLGFGRTDLKEVLDKDADMGDYIKDFQKSDAPQFKGKSKEKRKDMAIAAYLSKNESLLDKVNVILSEDGHADVVSMRNKIEIAQKALTKMQSELSKLGDEDSLPTWWTNKVATAVSRIDDMSDYLDTQVEEHQLDEKIAALVKKAKKSGMPYSILKKVYDRGMAAYKTGHRPGATPQQWALARVNSFTTKSSGTWGKADKDLAKQVRGEEFDDDVDESLWANIHKKRQRIKRGSGERMRKKGEKGAPTAAQMKRAKGEEAELNEWGEITEKAEYNGRPVDLNNPTKGDVKKYKVYVKNEKGNVVKVEFGDPNMEIKRDDPARRANFRARHNCDNPGPKYKARYWSCKFWSAKSVTDLMKG